MSVTPKQLMNAAKHIAGDQSAVLDNRWQVTSAALARQALENAVTDWLTENDAENDRANWKVKFLLLRTLHPDQALAGEAHNAWARLSEACHAKSYDLPPTEQELRRWFVVVDRFVTS